MENAYIRLYTLPENGDVLMISNNGGAVEAALQNLQGYEGLSDIGVYDNSADMDYVAPSNVSEAGEEPQHNIYKYRLSAANAALQGESLAQDLESRLGRGVDCEVRYERG